MNNKRLTAEILLDDQVVLTIDENLLNAEINMLDRSDVTNVVDWGIFANRGSLSFIDNSGLFNVSSETLDTIKSATVYIYICKVENRQIATFNIDDCLYDEETKQVRLSLISKLIDWQNIFSNYSNIYIFNEETIGNIVSQISTEYGVQITLGEDVYDILNTTISCTFLENESLWSVMTKICQASMSRIIEDEYGNAILTGQYVERTPIVLSTSNVLKYESFDFVQVANTSIDVISRDKYTGVIPEALKKTIALKWDDTLPIPNPIVSNGDKIVIGEMTPIFALKSYRNGNGSISIISPYKIYRIVNIYPYTDKRTVENFTNVSEREGVYTQFVENSTLTNNSDINLKINLTVLEVDYQEGDLPYKATTVTSMDIKISADYFIDSSRQTITNIIDSNKKSSIYSIASNELIQSENYHTTKEFKNISHGQYILQKVEDKYSNGVECLTCDCLFNNYYKEDGELIYSRDTISSSLQRYDIIIPYTKKNGVLTPLRKKKDGTPKQFRIVGISYLYDGFLTQKLQLQEET